MTDSNKPANKPHIEYRVQLEKKIEINKSFSERRNQAVAMRILSYGLFGQKRYQNLYLSCSLNCFHLALRIANQIHQRVAGLAMIIKFENVQVLEYFSESFEGRYFDEKNYSKIVIKLTRNPTEEDKKEPGFNPGLDAQEVQQPITEVLKRKKRPELRQQGSKISHQEKQNRTHNSKDQPQSYIKRQDNRDNRDNRDHDRRQQTRPKKQYREAKDETIDEREYRRGEKKVRGRGERGGGRHHNEGQRDTQRDTHYSEKKLEYKEKDEKKGKVEEKGGKHDNKGKGGNKPRQESQHRDEHVERNEKKRPARKNRYEDEA